VIRDQQGDPLGMVRGGKSSMFVTDDVGSVTGIVGSCGRTHVIYQHGPYRHLSNISSASGGSLVNDNLIGHTESWVQHSSRSALHLQNCSGELSLSLGYLCLSL
jgi:hypothetical protein